MESLTKLDEDPNNDFVLSNVYLNQSDVPVMNWTAILDLGAKILVISTHLRLGQVHFPTKTPYTPL